MKQIYNRFQRIFANQCSLITSSRILPTDYELFTDESLSNVIFTDNGIGSIIRDLGPNKTHSHNIISIHMLKIVGVLFTDP